ncbi:MAG: uroporphyrinogen decarboxylase [Betaproteobacteria bacterium RIFCSPLOWO2_02_FULL_67_19]|nr:MAG: uroporphyrinogen decarboxylase [Betaproteobacteria bacterium RIFCSPLOWO2_02_FULL_67_19]
MSPLENDTLLRALGREPTDYTPLWLMRQAGRYLPEYNALRARAGSFLALAKTPALACEVTLQPLQRFRLDAAILFSDILTVPDAMGLGLYFADGEGPRFERPLRDEVAIRRLAAPDPATELNYVLEAVRQIRRALAGRVPLIGFSGSPYTLACYMVEGSGSSDFPALKKMLFTRPDLLHHILAVNAQAIAAYLNAQIEAGAQAVMIFDTWGGNLSAAGYEEYSLAYARRVLAALTRQHDGRKVPAILFTKGGGQWLEAMAASGFDAIGLDWTADAAQARHRVGARVALQGNLDPAALYAPPESVRAEARRVLDAFGPSPGHVFNLGHGITPQASPDAVAALVDEVRTYSRALRHRQAPASDARPASA